MLRVRGKTFIVFVAILLLPFTIISLKIISMRGSSTYNEVSFKGHFYRIFQKSSTNFIAVQNLTVLQLQKEKVENVKASKVPPEIKSKAVTGTGLIGRFVLEASRAGLEAV